MPTLPSLFPKDASLYIKQVHSTDIFEVQMRSKDAEAITPRLRECFRIAPAAAMEKHLGNSSVPEFEDNNPNVMTYSWVYRIAPNLLRLLAVAVILSSPLLLLGGIFFVLGSRWS